MTRKLLSLVFVALLAITANAQSLVGKWITSIDLEDDNSVLLVELNLNSDNTAELSFALGGVIQMDEETKMSMLILSFADKAKWQSSKNQISFDINQDAIKYELTELKINDEEASSLRSLFEKELLNECKADFDEFWQMFNDNALLIMSHTDSELVVTDGETEMKFFRQ